METLFDDIPDPEPEYPPDTGPWMPTKKLQAALDDLAMGLTATQKSIAAAFDVPLDVLTEPEASKPPLITMPLEKSPGPKWLPGGMGPVKPVTEGVPNVPAPTGTPYVPDLLGKYGFTKMDPVEDKPFTNDELDNLTQAQIVGKMLETEPPADVPGKAMDWNQPLAPVTTGHGWMKDLLMKPVHSTPIMLKLPLTMVEHNYSHGMGVGAELTFEAQSHLGDCRVVLTSNQWTNLGKPQTLTVQILGE